MNLPGTLSPTKQLSAQYDADRLADDLRTLPEAQWRVHEFSLPNRASGTYPEAILWNDPGPVPALALCPALNSFLRTFPARVRHARLANLTAGLRIASHIDRADRYQDDAVTLHVPISTNPRAQIVVVGKRYHMSPGELWFLDTYCLHSIANRGTTSRIHLILECEPDESINKLLGFDIEAYRKNNILAHHEQYARFLRREQRWKRLAESSSRDSERL
ncbi:MAG TPA: aspartyl/asparaginyl beta-hydroxylase domain-containing protein [Pseudomonadales bacterium]|nr:aspartyl/asparaginyl beta-hydroxylase domain-containing protein [Pseudomonadales bacterium]